MRKIIYVSGPLSHATALGVAENCGRFDIVENMLLRAGYCPINPASDWSALKIGGITRRDLMEKDEALVKRSDALYMLPGYEDSPGAMQELKWAQEEGTPYFDNLNDLNEYFGTIFGDWVDQLSGEPDA